MRIGAQHERGVQAGKEQQGISLQSEAPSAECGNA